MRGENYSSLKWPRTFTVCYIKHVYTFSSPYTKQPVTFFLFSLFRFKCLWIIFMVTQLICTKLNTKVVKMYHNKTKAY